MTRIQFIFLSAMLLVFAAFSGFKTVALPIQLAWAVSLIILFGIPHGAIDHIISQEESKVKPLQFYAFYFGMMGLYMVSWIFLPLWSFIFFLIISAFHFGQSQFSDLSRVHPVLHFLLNFSWGISILSGLIFYNLADIRSMSQISLDVAQLSPAYNYAVSLFSLIISSALSLSILIYLVLRKIIGVERFFSELYMLALIHVAFFTLPLIVGFTLYFAILHSLKVLVEEFSYLKKNRKGLSVPKFIKLLFPYTLISVIGCIGILLCSKYGLINSSGILLIFVLISILTLPHSIVMSDFYQKLYKVD